MTTDLALAADPAVIERAADPGEYVVQACRQALALLHDALEHGGIDQIAEIKSQAEAVRVYTVQKQLGVDAQLAAAEIVRRADRGIGIAVRRGQESGEIRKPNENNGPRSDYTRSGKPVHVDPGNDESRVSPGGKNSSSFYVGTGQSRADIYAMTDGVSDEEFEDVLAEAKAEQNLSRNNVVRKIRQRKARQERAAASRDDGEQVPEPRDRSSAAAARRAELIGRWAGEGSTSRQIAGILLWEQGIIYAGAIVLGLAFGIVLTSVAVPVLVFTGLPAHGPMSNLSISDLYLLQHALPARVIIPFSLDLIFAALVVICLVALFTMVRAALNPSISNELRLNED